MSRRCGDHRGGGKCLSLTAMIDNPSANKNTPCQHKTAKSVESYYSPPGLVAEWGYAVLMQSRIMRHWHLKTDDLSVPLKTQISTGELCSRYYIPLNAYHHRSPTEETESRLPSRPKSKSCLSRSKHLGP